MCKYCEPCRYPTRLDVSSEIVGFCAKIDPITQKLVFWGTIDGGFFGEEGVEGAIEINYCPICGKKLNVDSE